MNVPIKILQKIKTYFGQSAMINHNFLLTEIESSLKWTIDCSKVIKNRRQNDENIMKLPNTMENDFLKSL